MKKTFKEDQGYIELESTLTITPYSIIIDKLKLPWDKTSFRPLMNYILKMKKYKGVILMEKQNNLDGKVIFIPRKIKIIDSDTFVNVR